MCHLKTSGFNCFLNLALMWIPTERFTEKIFVKDITILQVYIIAVSEFILFKLKSKLKLHFVNTYHLSLVSMPVV